MGRKRDWTGFGRLRLVLLACAVSFFAIVVPLGARAAVSDAPACSTGQLRLDFVEANGAAGTQTWTLSLRNVDPHTCQLNGFPVAVLLDAQARVENVKIVHSGSSGGAVTLAPWQAGYVNFRFVTSGPCVPHDFSAYGLRVRPPGARGSLVYYSGRFGLCSVSVGGHPSISAVTAHPQP